MCVSHNYACDVTLLDVTSQAGGPRGVAVCVTCQTRLDDSRKSTNSKVLILQGPTVKSPQ